MPGIKSDTALLTRVDKTFSFYTDNTHIQRLVKKGLSSPLPPESDIKAWETCPIKLHISMDTDSYLRYYEKIIDLLKNYVKPTILFQFKHVNINLIHEKREFKTQIFDAFDIAVQNYLRDPKNIVTIKPVIELCKKFQFSEEDIVSFLRDEDYRNQKLKELTDLKNEHLRFLNADQFTLYIPSDFNRKKIYAMCRDIQNFMLALPFQAVPGLKSDAACQLTSFINVRQEYLEGDDERINAVLTAKCNLEKRQQALSQIQSHELYIFLSTKMMKNLLPRTSSSPLLFTKTSLNKRGKEASPPPSPSSVRLFQPIKMLMKSLGQKDQSKYQETGVSFSKKS